MTYWMCKNVYKGLICLRWYLEGLIFNDVSEWTVVSSSQTVYGCTRQEYELYDDLTLSNRNRMWLSKKKNKCRQLCRLDYHTVKITFTINTTLNLLKSILCFWSYASYEPCKYPFRRKTDDSSVVPRPTITHRLLKTIRLKGDNKTVQKIKLQSIV